MDLSTLARVFTALNAAAYAAGANNGTSIDTLGYAAEDVTFLCVTNNGTSGTTTFKLQDSADNSSWADITGATTAAIAEAEDNEVFVVQLTSASNHRRYVRVVATVAVATTTSSFALAIVGAPVKYPPPTQQNTVVRV